MPAHHAYYVEGPLAAFGAYKEHLQPFYAQEYEKFGIEEARELITAASLKNYEHGVFLLGIASLTSEAQQAMLKLFEEPQQGTQFIVMVPHGTLLPTLRSRMMEYPEKEKLTAGRLGSSQRDPQQVSLFLKLSSKERSDFITKLLKDDEGTKERVRDFINALEAELYARVGPTRSNTRQALEDIAMVRDYLRDRSPSLKMLLEHLAIGLPVA